MTLTEAMLVLGLSSDADPAELRRAYRDLAQVWHPDRFQHNERLRAMAEAQFKRLSQAYQLLSEFGMPPDSPEQEPDDASSHNPHYDPDAEDTTSPDGPPNPPPSPPNSSCNSEPPTQSHKRLWALLLTGIAATLISVAILRPNTQPTLPYIDPRPPLGPVEVPQAPSLASPNVTPSGSNASAGIQVLGNLGQALEPTPIYANTNTRARVYYRVKADEYLVVREFKYPEWRKVLLQNGRFGYVQSEKVAELPYEVTLDNSKVATVPDQGNAAAQPDPHFLQRLIDESKTTGK